MTFTERIKQLREERKLPQRKLAAPLDIDSATYWKRERGERKAKREQVIAIAKILNYNKNELLILWLADKIITSIGSKKELKRKVLKVMEKEVNQY